MEKTDGQNEVLARKGLHTAKLRLQYLLRRDINKFATNKEWRNKLHEHSDIRISEQEFRLLIHDLRKEGVPIASSIRQGYALVDSKEVLEETAKWLEHKARDHFHTAKILREILKDDRNFQYSMFVTPKTRDDAN